MTADLGPSPCMYLRVSVWSRLGVGFGVVISGCVYERGKYLGQCLGGGGGGGFKKLQSLTSPKWVVQC